MRQSIPRGRCCWLERPFTDGGANCPWHHQVSSWRSTRRAAKDREMLSAIVEVCRSGHAPTVFSPTITRTENRSRISRPDINRISAAASTPSRSYPRRMYTINIKRGWGNIAVVLFAVSGRWWTADGGEHWRGTAILHARRLWAPHISRPVDSFSRRRRL